MRPGAAPWAWTSPPRRRAGPGPPTSWDRRRPSRTGSSEMTVVFRVFAGGDGAFLDDFALIGRERTSGGPPGTAPATYRSCVGGLHIPITTAGRRTCTLQPQRINHASPAKTIEAGCLAALDDAAACRARTRSGCSTTARRFVRSFSSLRTRAPRRPRRCTRRRQGAAGNIWRALFTGPGGLCTKPDRPRGVYATTYAERKHPGAAAQWPRSPGPWPGKVDSFWVAWPCRWYRRIQRGLLRLRYKVTRRAAASGPAHCVPSVLPPRVRNYGK